jgi:hypothetical protein
MKDVYSCEKHKQPGHQTAVIFPDSGVKYITFRIKTEYPASEIRNSISFHILIYLPSNCNFCSVKLLQKAIQIKFLTKMHKKLTNVRIPEFLCF